MNKNNKTSKVKGKSTETIKLTEKDSRLYRNNI